MLTDSQGNFSNLVITVPSGLAAGTYTVSANDGAASVNVATKFVVGTGNTLRNHSRQSGAGATSPSPERVFHDSRAVPEYELGD